MSNEMRKEEKQNSIEHDLVLAVGAVDRTTKRVIRAKEEEDYGNPKVSYCDWQRLEISLLAAELNLRYVLEKLKKAEEKEN